MERYVKSQGMYVIEKFVGHGIGRDMHEEPQVPNFVSKALRRNDIRLEPGIVLAVEPMVALGTKQVKALADGWTIVTKDNRGAAHFEHTVAMTPDGPRILTLPRGRGLSRRPSDRTCHAIDDRVRTGSRRPLDRRGPRLARRPRLRGDTGGGHRPRETHWPHGCWPTSVSRR